MSFPGSLRTFLVTAKTYLRSAVKEGKVVELVVGNESADLDSTTSAILYAYIRTASSRHSSPSNSFTATTNSSSKSFLPSQPTIYVPVMNIPRADIAIRPELLWLLPKVGLDANGESLITLDDVIGAQSNGTLKEDKKQDELMAPGTVNFTLVDHNKLTGVLAAKYSASSGSSTLSLLASSTAKGALEANFTACIDHHADEGFVPETANPRMITTAGSCTSLVLQYLRPTWDGLSPIIYSSDLNSPAELEREASADDRRVWDAQLAKLAITSILIDTACLYDADKTTSVDREAVEYLERRISLAENAIQMEDGDEWEKGRWNRERWWKECVAAKENLDNLSVRDVLRKDYKEWIEESSGSVAKGAGKSLKLKLGYASVVKPLSWLIKKAEKQANIPKEEVDASTDADKEGVENKAIMSTLRDFVQEREIDVFTVGTAFTQGGDEESEEFQRELLLWVANPEAGYVMDAFVNRGTKELRLVEWRAGKRWSSDESLRAWKQQELKASRKQVGPLLREVIRGDKG